MQTVTTIEFDQTLGQLDGMATSLGRPRSWVVKSTSKNTWDMKRGSGRGPEGLDAVAEGKIVSNLNHVLRSEITYC